MSLKHEGTTNYTKDRPIHGLPCPNCNTTMQMLTMRTKNEWYKKSFIQMCPNGCRTVRFLEPVIPIQNNTAKLHNANLQTLMSIDIMQLEGIAKKNSKELRNDQGLFSCFKCINEVLSKTKSMPEEVKMSIYPIVKHDTKLCFRCLHNGKHVQAEGVIQIKQLVKIKS